jgi:hypothetical protein
MVGYGNLLKIYACMVGYRNLLKVDMRIGGYYLWMCKWYAQMANSNALAWQLFPHKEYYMGDCNDLHYLDAS